jgi:hypothetical protein
VKVQTSLCTNFISIFSGNTNELIACLNASNHPQTSAFAITLICVFSQDFNWFIIFESVLTELLVFSFLISSNLFCASLSD